MGTTIQKVLYEVTEQNTAAIVAGASQFFLTSNDTKQANQQYKSFNYLEIINDSNEEITIDLDGLSTRRRRLFGKSVIVIKAEEGTYFNNVLITNADSVTQIDISQLTVIGKIVMIIG